MPGYMLRPYTNLIFLLLTLAASAQTPKELPAPTGSYPVGTRYLNWTDYHRQELFTDVTSDRREITAQVWYPAEPYPQGKLAPYLLGADEIVARYKLPDSFRKVRTHAKVNAQIADDQPNYPVLIFNHGWGEYFAQSTILMEELASHGYFVFSIAHHYEAKFSYYPNGRVETMEAISSRFRQILLEQRQPESQRLLDQLLTVKTATEQEQLCVELTKKLPTYFRETPRYWAQDIMFVLNELEKMSHSHPSFRGKLALEQVGVFGMSMGGVAAGQACLQDQRFKAGLSLDGAVFGDLLDKKIGQPFMFLSGARYRNYSRFFLGRLQGDGYVVTIDSADHFNFHDVALLEPEHPQLGSIGAERGFAVINAWVRAFFDYYLLGKESDLLTRKSKDFPEVEISVKKGRR